LTATDHCDIMVEPNGGFEMSWKEQDKEKKTKNKKFKNQPKKENKPFQVSNYRFFPCNWSNNIEEGYEYYLIIRGYSTTLVRHESDSPRFKSEKDAKEFAITNKDYSFVPA
jgi:hypothetical protein